MKTVFKKTVIASSVAAISASLSPAVSFAEEFVFEEIVVTATRRSQSIQDVPYNISALTGDDLTEKGIATQSDLFRVMPGVNYVDQGPRSGVNNSSLIIRGINSEYLARNSGPLQTAPVVSTYINETPMFVNLRLTDMERVEVLRGPQGTLYGSGSLGGSVRYIYNEADPQEFYGSISGGLSQTKNGDGLNYETDLLLNVPVSDSFAVRLNLGYVDAAGFIDQEAVYSRNADGTPILDNGSSDPFGDSDNFFTGQPVFESLEGANTAEIQNARLSATWIVSEALELSASYHQQSDEVGGTQMISHERFGKESLSNATLIEEPFERDVEVAALDMDFDMGFASFSASASSYHSEGEGSRDLTGFYEQFGFYESYYGTSPRPLIEDVSTFDDEGTVFEARMTSNSESNFEWIVGAFHFQQDLDLAVVQSFHGYDDYANACFITTGTFGGVPCGFGTLYGLEETNGAVPIVKDEAYLSVQSSEFEDSALFGELSYHLSEAWQVTAGFRVFEQEYSSYQFGGLEFFPGAIEERALSDSDSGSLFKFNTSYALDEDTNVYFVWSEGFRRGGINGLPNTAFGFPINEKALSYAPDTTENIELGIKGDLFGNYRYTLAYYDIQWDSIQSNISCTGLGLLCVANAGEAKSSGIELDVQGQMSEHLNVQVSYSYNDSELSSLSDVLQEFIDDGTAFIAIEAGGSLPGASENTLYVAANYETSPIDGLDVFYSINGSYRSEARSTLFVDDVLLDGFWQWNASASFAAENWSVRAYVNNIADERGLLGADSSSSWGGRANAIVSMPRTFGLSGQYTF